MSAVCSNVEHRKGAVLLVRRVRSGEIRANCAMCVSPILMQRQQRVSYYGAQTQQQRPKRQHQQRQITPDTIRPVAQ